MGQRENRVWNKREKKKNFCLRGNPRRDTTRFGFCWTFLVKRTNHTNQGEFVRLCLMLKSEERRRENTSNASYVNRKRESNHEWAVRRIRRRNRTERSEIYTKDIVIDLIMVNWFRAYPVWLLFCLVIVVIIFFENWLKLLISFLNSHKTKIGTQQYLIEL